jgi:hypothetical protein
MMRPETATGVPPFGGIAMTHSREIFCQKQTQFSFLRDKFDPRAFARFAALGRGGLPLVVIVN